MMQGGDSSRTQCTPLTDTQEREPSWAEDEKGGCELSPLSSGDMGTR